MHELICPNCKRPFTVNEDDYAAILSQVKSAEFNAEVDRLREELSPKVKQMNDILTAVKTAYGENKKTLKGYYPQERWADYGISDKR